MVNKIVQLQNFLHLVMSRSWILHMRMWLRSCSLNSENENNQVNTQPHKWHKHCVSFSGRYSNCKNLEALDVRQTVHQKDYHLIHARNSRISFSQGSSKNVFRSRGSECFQKLEIHKTKDNAKFAIILR